jgi:phage terminase small subunit
MTEKNKDKLTGKQEKAAQHYVEHGNKSAAYRHAYSTKNQAEKTINENASRLFANSKVLARVKELQDATLKRHEITVDSLAAEYEEAKQLALKIERPEAAIKAIDGKARITGHDKKVIDLKSTDGSMSPTGINWIEDEGGE